MIKKLSLYTIALLGCLVLFNSCKKEYENIEALDERLISEYLAKNNITAEKDPSGFYYQIITPGTGEEIVNEDSVYYSYDFKHTNGTSFLKSPEYQSIGNRLGYVDNFGFKLIPGVRLTMAKLNRGGSAKVILPSRMAFGKNGQKSLGVESNEVIVIDFSVLAPENQVEMDNYLIDKFVAANKLQMTIDPNRVQYSISAEGTGKADVKETSKVKVKYTGRYLNGTVFDSSAEGAEFKLDEVIEAWTKTIPGKIGMGGKMRLLVPSDLAYGKSGKNSIPPNTCLDFDIEILSVTND